ncbi:MAG: YoaP domain-containing protein [Bacteroidales bacterium]|nr:YoaP domain-containing protein [Bacteroidales bacterium]
MNAIIESAKKMKLEVHLVDLKSVYDVQNSPCPFGTFGIIYNGKVISHHPISNTRFENMMKK